jgi:uncharacterized protein (DUF1800 family)
LFEPRVKLPKDVLMSVDQKAEAANALDRFGLGPRPGSIAAIASDPRGALLAELDRPNAGRIDAPDLLTSGEAAREAFAFRQMRRQERQAAQAKRSGGEAMQKDAASESMQSEQGKRKNGPNAIRRIFLKEADARLTAALSAEIGFAERLAWFWSNHFCVSAAKGPVRALCGAYEREAIRDNLGKRFGDMLLAVETHPAMLLYLDNARSIGPDSPAGRRRKRGLNENLAREILELHTLGVRTGYTQDDVTRFANVITGWTIRPLRRDPQHGGEFVFNPRMHEPGAQTVLGTRYDERGAEQGRAVLHMLARHPATAQHIATKLARHFVADDPPASLVERLSKRFRDSDGDLKEVAKALVTAPEAWQSPRAKLRRPSEWIVAALRASRVDRADVRRVIQAQAMLGEPLWRPPAPNGFADDNGSWLDGLANRLDIANQFARRIAGNADPQAIYAETLAPIASTETRQTIARAESRPQALALLFMAPEFQRR